MKNTQKDIRYFLMKTFQIAGPINGFFTIESGQIISCSQKYSWAIHLRPEILINWLSKKGKHTWKRI